MVAALPSSALQRIVEILGPAQIWLFGSRARGSARSDSDWDVMVVRADSESTLFDDVTWAALRDVRRAGVELVAICESDFEAERDIPGTFAQVVATEGHLLHER